LLVFKTSVMVARISHLIGSAICPSDRILAVTFTREAATELEQRLKAKLGWQGRKVTAGTFHSISARFLRRHPETAGLKEGFSIAEPAVCEALVAELLEAVLEDDLLVVSPTLSLPARDSKGRLDQELVRRISAAIGAYKEIGFTPEAVAAVKGKEEDSLATRLAKMFYADYQRRLRDGNMADFGDLMMWPVLAMEENEDLRRSWASQWSYVLVDEYQDVNELQARWLGLVVRDHNNITAVGDDDQAIYGWRGADVNYILQFERSYPGAGIVKLERNYRCSRRIIAAANAVIANNEMRRGKLLKAAASDEEGRKIRIASAVDGEMEAAWIAREIERIGAETEIVLLYRANFQSRPLEEGLVSAGIAYTIVGDDCFYDRLEIRDALAYVELALYGRDEAEGERAFDAFARIHDRPARGVGEAYLSVIAEARGKRSFFEAAGRAAKDLPAPARKGLAVLDKASADFLDGCETGDLGAALTAFMEDLGYLEHWEQSPDPLAARRIDNLKELFACASTSGSPRRLLARAARAREAETEDASVRLMTIHGAKGREAETVFLVGWTEGLFPSGKAEQDGQIEEERRLAYVGLTRAKRRCLITMAGQPSRFVGEIPDALVWHYDISEAENHAAPEPAHLALARQIAEGRAETLTDDQESCREWCAFYTWEHDPDR